MKKFLLLISSILFVIIANAQYVTIPDSNFRTFLQQKYPSCFNAQGMMDTTCSVIINEKRLAPPFNVFNLTGLQYFKTLHYLNLSFSIIDSLSNLPNSLDSLDCSYAYSLTYLSTLPNSLTYLKCSFDNSLVNLSTLPNSLIYLDCSGDTRITALPVLPNSLRILKCSHSSGNQGLSMLPALPNSLIYLDCSRNPITSLPPLPNSLTDLRCSNDSLTTLPVLPVSLNSLSCSYNQISSLPALPNKLTYLSCTNNTLTNLPDLPGSLNSLICSSNQILILPGLPNTLTYLNCGSNPINSLPALPNTLTTFYCGSTKLPGLPKLPDALRIFGCQNGGFTSLPNLPPLLNQLDCSGNKLTGLPALPDSLTDLTCNNNFIYCLPKLPSTLWHLNIDALKIHCVPNIVRGILIDSEDTTISLVNPPLCNPTNNIQNCQEFPLLTGTVFYDNNSNGVKDAGELYRPYITLQLSNGAYTFTNTNGYYEIGAVDGLGSYTLTAYAPPYYKAVPVLTNYNFTSFDTLVTQNIALQPIAPVDSLSLFIYSVHRNIRPGFDFPVIINYTNVGTTTVLPVITFNYDNQLLTYDSSSNHSVINNGNSLSLTETNLVPGQSNNFIAYFTAKTTDILGDTVKTKVSITSNAFSFTDSISNVISGSLDPNDKEATPQLTPEQVQKGKSIQYTISFQNTGTDTAFNIVIA
ncbi:MAG: hypothetical protein M3Z01_02185, partial [Thermoproteota archaeon]|nr:hypothetical protein [Thermoproteota archaeon]